MAIRARIKSVGIHLPDDVLRNSDLEKTLDTSDEWIRTRTGIQERRIVGKESTEMASCLGAKASQQALERCGVSPQDVDCIICGTFTPDAFFPSTACVLQEKIGAKKATAFDISAACSGFLYGLTLADSLIRARTFRTILLVGTEIISRAVNWQDRNTCVLFGDGAGAVVIRAEDGEHGILSTATQTDGSLGAILNMPVCGNERYIHMNGGEVFKHAVRRMGESTLKAVEKAKLTTQDVDCFVPHQANIRIIQSAARSIKLPFDKVFVNVNKYGNTSSASIPLALFEAVEEGKIKEESIVVMAAVGGGLTWGAVAVRW